MLTVRSKCVTSLPLSERKWVRSDDSQKQSMLFDMKLRCPKYLAVALLASMACAYAATEMVTESAVITGDVTKTDAVIVQGGTLTVGDGSTATDVVFSGDEKDVSLAVSGVNATVVFDNANVSVIGDSQWAIGDKDFAEGSGTMIVDNGSYVDMSNGNTLYMGYGTTAELTVKGGSTFIGGYNNFWTYGDSVINVDGVGSELRLCTTTKGYNYRVLLGCDDDVTSTFNVTDGGKIVSSATQFVSNFHNGTTTNINVDGEGSSFVYTAETDTNGSYQSGQSGNWVYRGAGELGSGRPAGWYDEDSTGASWSSEKGQTTIYLGDSGTDKNGCKYRAVSDTVTNISATNGGTIDFQSNLVYCGSFQEASENNVVSFNVDKDSSVTVNRMEVYSEVDVTNDGGSFNVNGDMALHSGSVLVFNLTDANTEKEAITLGNGAKVKFDDESDSGVTVKVNLPDTANVKAGTKYILFNDENALSGVTYTLSGADVEVTTDGTNTFITLLQDYYVARDPFADALGAAAWGAFKSTQAFTGALRGNRTNAVNITPAVPVAGIDSKGRTVQMTMPTGQTIVWGTVYGSFSRLSTSGNCGGAEYSIYGGAVGVEHTFVSGRSLGVAVGYDWGKVSPFNYASFDQESAHAAVYGRAGQWSVGKASTLALDLAAAVGSTESELPCGDLTQDNLQLDARLSYIRSLTEKTSVSGFVGAQYYAQEDDSVGDNGISSMQNLRVMIGAGISHALTAKTTVFAEASLYNDAMRHNPRVTVDGIREDVASPGRTGGNVTVGAAYQLNDSWTLHANYGFEAAKNSTEHSVNAGVIYKF